MHPLQLPLAHAVVAPELPDGDAMRGGAVPAYQQHVVRLRAALAACGRAVAIAIRPATAASCTARRRHGRIAQRPRTHFSYTVVAKRPFLMQ
jgi:hypothetical protein